MRWLGYSVLTYCKVPGREGFVWSSFLYYYYFFLFFFLFHCGEILISFRQFLLLTIIIIIMHVPACYKAEMNATSFPVLLVTVRLHTDTHKHTHTQLPCLVMLNMNIQSLLCLIPPIIFSPFAVVLPLWLTSTNVQMGADKHTTSYCK